jgi:hypothetical protein
MMARTPEQNERLGWLVEALRSGLFEQCRYTLMGRLEFDEPGKDCCLNVANKIYRTMVGGFFDQNHFYADIEPAAAYNSATHLPQVVREWFGLSYDEMYGLVSLNDSSRKSFNEIADHIEQNLIGK